MKKIILLLVILFAFPVRSNGFRMHGGGINFSYFYVSLSPYGEWIQLSGDLVVWHPTTVGYNWSPYEYGEWEWTDYGWYWQSFEPFGWATCHYGRWLYDDYYGWIWVPDYQWAPAWVEWRYNSDYIGWAPLPPYAGFDVNLGIHFVVRWRSDYRYWHFVPYRRFAGYNAARYSVSISRRRALIRSTKYRTNYLYRNGRIINYGVSRKFVEKRSRRRIVRKRLDFTDNVRIASRTQKVSRNVIKAFRPSRETVKRVRADVKFRRGGRSSLLRNKVIVGRRSFSENRFLRRRSKRNEERIFKSGRRKRDYFSKPPSRIGKNRRLNDAFRKLEDLRKSRPGYRNRSFPQRKERSLRKPTPVKRRRGSAKRPHRRMRSR